MFNRGKQSKQTDPKGKKARVAKARKSSLIVLLLLLGVTVWFAGSYHVVRTGEGVRVVKKTQFSLKNVVVSLEGMKEMAPGVAEKRLPKVLEALRQDPYFADDMKQIAQESVGDMKEAALTGATTVTDGMKTGASAVQASIR